MDKTCAHQLSLFGAQVPENETYGIQVKHVREAAKKGTTCPVCSQYVKIYLRTINHEMARTLAIIFRHFHKWPHSKPIHVDSYLSAISKKDRPKGNNHSLLVYWGLLQPCKAKEKNGKMRTGYYAITSKGCRFVLGKDPVNKYAVMYNNNFYGLQGDLVFIRDVIRKNFDLQELLEREVDA